MGTWYVAPKELGNPAAGVVIAHSESELSDEQYRYARKCWTTDPDEFFLEHWRATCPVEVLGPDGG